MERMLVLILSWITVLLMLDHTETVFACHYDDVTVKLRWWKNKEEWMNATKNDTEKAYLNS